MIDKFRKFWNHTQTISDKKRYDHTYTQLEKLDKIQLEGLIGLKTVPTLMRPAYQRFYDEIENVLINKDLVVLELGSGFGKHTSVIANTGVNLMIFDISEVALKINNIINCNLYKTIQGSLDSIPLPDKSVDVVISCTSLSYANPKKTDHEILRILRPGGHLIVIDSLNHNPIYRLNRLFKLLAGTRSVNSVCRIPKMGRITALSRHFEISEVSFYGKWLWFLVPLSKCFHNLTALNNRLDKYGSNRLAFQFVLVCKKYSQSRENPSRFGKK